MKTNRPLLTIVFFIVGIISIKSQSLEKLKAFTMTVHGNSTLHEWESKVAKAVWNGDVSIDENGDINIQKSEVKILVKDIQSNHGRIMDGKTYEAFNYEKNPYIIFSLKEAVQSNSQVQVDGLLTMNGTVKHVTFKLNMKPLASNDVQFTGSYTLKMTDYKMSPPTAMMGTIKVADEVTIKFDLTISK